MLKKFLFLMLLCTSAKAEWAAEVDPLAFLSKGYSGHVIYQTHGVAVDVGAFGMEFPGFAEPVADFRTKFAGYGVKVNYYGKNPEGGFFGIGGGTSRFEVQEKSTLEQQSFTVNSVGVQTGYRWGRKGFYLTPWVGFNWVIDPPELSFSGKKYQCPGTNIFPTIHLGYQF